MPLGSRLDYRVAFSDDVEIKALYNVPTGYLFASKTLDQQAGISSLLVRQW